MRKMALRFHAVTVRKLSAVSLNNGDLKHNAHVRTYVVIERLNIGICTFCTVALGKPQVQC